MSLSILGKAFSYIVVEIDDSKVVFYENLVVSARKCMYKLIDLVILITGIYPPKTIIAHVQKKADCTRC